jgi:serine/threonine protein kinase
MISEHISLISQGTYGCIFAKKDTKKPSIVENITKIQKKEETSENETKIGKKIMGLKNYDEYFAPVLKTENINITQISKDEVDKCDFIHNNKDTNTKYESSEIKYIGEDSLKKFFSKTIIDTFEFISIFISDHIILLEALEKLISIGIVHYDLKENNIIIRTNDKRPIIIDFGLSINTENTNSDAFYRYYADYAPWCIDIVFLCFMANEKGKEWQTQIISQDDINFVLNDYFKKNYGVIDLLLPEEQIKWKSELQIFFNSYINRPWNELYMELLKYRFTWDNYSLSILFLFMFEELEIIRYIDEFPILRKYRELLKTNMTQLPNKRMIPTEVKTTLLSLFKTINRKKLNNIKKQIRAEYKNKGMVQTMEKNIALSILNDKKHEDIIYSNQ